MPELKSVQVDLDVPTHGIRVVTMHPHLRVDPDNSFRLDVDRDQHLSAIERTLRLAKGNDQEGGATFTIFPEYTLSLGSGIECVEQALRSTEWTHNSVIIGGIEGVTKEEYRALCSDFDLEVAETDKPDQVSTGDWVNCCITWIKDRSGSIRRWAQPKIQPAWPEEAHPDDRMHRGGAVHLFRGGFEDDGPPFPFFSLICFDWIASAEGSSVLEDILRQVDETAQSSGQRMSLQLVNVIQHNDQPNHHAFLQATTEFFTKRNRHRWVERDNSVVLHVNTAGKDEPIGGGISDYGFSSCVFGPQAPFSRGGCRPTVCIEPARLRKCEIQKRCYDVVFREMGACAHRFTFRVASFVEGQVGDRAYPVDLAEVHPLRASTDPRLPGGTVSAGTKWMNDSLDELGRLSAGSLNGSPLQGDAQKVEGKVEKDLRRFTQTHGVVAYVRWANAADVPRRESSRSRMEDSPDLWDDVESEALRHTFQTLTGIGLAFDVEVEPNRQHGTVAAAKEELPVRVVAIRGESHESCAKHFSSLPWQGNDPVLVISQDGDNSAPHPKEWQRIWDVSEHPSVKFLDFHRLQFSCTQANDRTELRRKLHGHVPQERPIV